MPSPRLLYVVTHGLTARYLLAGQLAWMRERGFEVAVACAPGADLDVAAAREGVEVFPVALRREIAPPADVRALAQLVRVMRRWRPDVVNAGTPKAGLLGTVAARLAGVPVRVYTLRGLRLETVGGASRRVLAVTERVAAACATDVLAVSPSLAERYAEAGFAAAPKVRVVGQGASNGVDVARFGDVELAEVERLRGRLGLEPDAVVVGFVGRLTRDKGIVELVNAFGRLEERVPNARLLLVGDFEAGDPVPADAVARVEASPRIVRAGFVTDTAPYYRLMDVLAFPSHREGFPNAPLEAAAAGVPVAGFRATGTVDAVADGVTGTLVGVGDADALAEALARYLTDSDLARAHGAAGRRRAAEHFSNEVVWGALAAEYERLLERRGR